MMRWKFLLMNGKQKNTGHNDGETLSEDERLKDMLQVLKEQSEKMEKLGLAFKVIQDGILQNTQFTIKKSVGGAAEVLDSLLNTHNTQLNIQLNTQLNTH